MSPITVNIGVVGAVDQVDLHQVLRQLFRIQELSLSGDFYSSDTLDELRKSAPLLQTLIVDQGNMQGPGSLCKDLVLGETPHLRHLDVRYGCLSWSDMPFPHQLTTLKLSHNPFCARRPTVTQLLFALKMATNLETLVLLNISLPPSQDEISQSGPIALLSYLSDIEIRSDFFSCIHLCRRISHPTPAYMKILCDVPHSHYSRDLLTEAPTDSLSELINKSVGPVKCLSMVLATDSDDYLGVHSIRTWPAPGPHWVPTISPPQFELHMVSHGFDSGLAAAKVIRAISVLLPRRDLQSLHVGNMYLREEFWVETFGHLEELRNIRLEKSGGNGFLCALSAGILDSDEGGDYEPTTMNFLGLHTLVCDEWEFDDRENDESPDLSQFLYYLQDRYGYQVALQDVYLWDCQNVDEDDIAKMRAAVGRLHWDGDAEAGSDSDVNSDENSDDE
ncbi:hypothetical protein Hypma_002835 [Hypsizygus marmoreus]|uniref:Uncharacterized protein n=1 Tax=Hypsizygus marmoreus TaxID=39966 RepID=A0A369J7Q8_HYPMA|nr:hypothetical protein Hypma_002835 [Hypsizygus marmoreus]